MSAYLEHFAFGVLFAFTGWQMQYVCARRGWHGTLHRGGVALALVAAETAAVVTVVG